MAFLGVFSFQICKIVYCNVCTNMVYYRQLTKQSTGKDKKMAVKILREEIVEIHNGLQFEVETKGELKLMPRNARMVFAAFGAFERTDQSTLLYTACVVENWEQDYTDKDDLLNSMDSEYLDDLNMLRSGNIEIIE